MQFLIYIKDVKVARLLKSHIKPKHQNHEVYIGFSFSFPKKLKKVTPNISLISNRYFSPLIKTASYSIQDKKRRNVTKKRFIVQ